MHAEHGTILRSRILADQARALEMAVTVAVAAVVAVDVGTGMADMGQKTDECRRCGKLGPWACECRSIAKKE
jgi:hypothetical protein